MRIKQFSILVVMVLFGCGESPGPGEPKTAAKPVGGYEWSADHLSSSRGSISDAQADTLHLSPRSSALREERQVNALPNKTLQPDSLTAKDIHRLRDQALYAGEPETRIKALEALAPLVQEDADAVLPTFEDAMRDNHEKVREAALIMIYRQSLSVSTDAVHEVAASDPVDAVRGRAWIALVERRGPELRGYLTDALKDPNPDIRRDAQWELDKLELGIR